MDVTYIVLKIGNKVFSTIKHKPKEGKKGKVRPGTGDNKYAREDEESIWCRGFFTEGKLHKLLKKPLKFELNIYYKKKKNNTI